MTRYVILVLCGLCPLAYVLGWGLLIQDCWVPGEFGIPRGQIASDHLQLTNGRPIPACYQWLVTLEMQETGCLFLVALSFTGIVGFYNRSPARITRVTPTPELRWELSQPILPLSKSDAWTISDACMGAFIIGATGSGKTTGPGAAIAKAFLRSGFGGLVVCIKPGECAQWKRYAQETGRSADVVVFDASCEQRYSFLDEELQRSGVGAGLTENIVNLFSIILEIADRQGGSGRDTEPYWKRALRQLVRNAVDLLVLSQGRVNIPDLYRLIISAPTSFEQLRSEEWRKESFCFQALLRGDQWNKTPQQAQDFRLVADYFTNEFPGLSDKTRSVVVSTFSSLADTLNRGLLRTLFSTDTTVRPEDTFDGKILIIDLPTKEFLEVGQFAAVLMKFCFQRRVERRDVQANPRPVFLWVDECQEVMTSFDMQFQSTARSSRVATVYLTQNISTMRAAFGSEQAEALTESLTGNLQSKFFCANGDPVTNEWAATIIGRSRQLFMNASHTESNDLWEQLLGSGGQNSAGVTEQMEFDIPPQEFTTLRTGGPQHKWQIDALLFQGGRRFRSSGRTWLPLTFRQDVK